MTFRFTACALTALSLAACGGSAGDGAATEDLPAGGGGSAGATDTSGGNDLIDEVDTSESEDLKDVILASRSASCADYVGTYTSASEDIQQMLTFESFVVIAEGSSTCSLASNSIPNHDFNDASARFATPVSEVAQDLEIPKAPELAATATALSQDRYNAILLNGVVLDILSAGCYAPDDPMADADGNTAIGCSADEPWLLDPLGTENAFGTDEHNAHTQPSGLYHYHGNPRALFDDSPGEEGSPVIGFAADGFPIFGTYFKDPSSGEVRKASSGYQLREGARPSGVGDPGGSYDGTYNDDYEFTATGDLDECNGMTVDGQYGYYVTDSYPWVLRCFSGTPHDSFAKGGGGGPPPM